MLCPARRSRMRWALATVWLPDSPMRRRCERSARGYLILPASNHAWISRPTGSLMRWLRAGVASTVSALPPSASPDVTCRSVPVPGSRPTTQSRWRGPDRLAAASCGQERRLARAACAADDFSSMFRFHLSAGLRLRLRLSSRPQREPASDHRAGPSRAQTTVAIEIVPHKHLPLEAGPAGPSAAGASTQCRPPCC